jgi:hypothetical protein
MRLPWPAANDLLPGRLHASTPTFAGRGGRPTLLHKVEEEVELQSVLLGLGWASC